MLCPEVLWVFCHSGPPVSKVTGSVCLHGALEGSVFQKIGVLVAQAGIGGEPGDAHWKLVWYMKGLPVQTGSNNSTEMQGARGDK